MIVDENVQNYLRNISQTKDSRLMEIEEYAKENNVPIIESEVKKFLDIIIRIKKPLKILEIGTAIGYSSIVMKLASKEAKITTIEINEDSYMIARKNIDIFGFQNDIHCILGDANEVLELLDDQFDVIFMDAAKGQYINFYDKSIDLLKVGGVLICDNILFRGMVAEEKYKNIRHRKITIVRRLAEFLEILYKDHRFKVSTVPIDDGMTIAYREE